MNDTGTAFACESKRLNEGCSKQQGDRRKAFNEDEREKEQVLSVAVQIWENLAEQIGENAAAWVVSTKPRNAIPRKQTNKQKKPTGWL